jgi:hypothetical protein
MTNNGNITTIIQNIFHDIRAEAIIADMIENGIDKDKIVCYSQGIFKRRYSRDIESIRNVKLENGQELFGVYLNRDGLYDALPEGLFHSRSEKTASETETSSKESKKLKQEEKAARNFFLPYENEIINQRIQLELEERKILSRFSEKLFDDIYPELWDLNKSLNRKYISKMVLLLHFANKIAGNEELTAKCLETILDETVEVKTLCIANPKTKIKHNSKQDDKNCLLGKNELGVNFICGHTFVNYAKTMQFNIGPLKNTDVTEYLEGGAISKFLTCFYSYFVPVDLEITSNILVDQVQQQFELNENSGGPILGFNSSI